MPKELPQGFTIDKQELPAGFVLDEQEPDHELMADNVERVTEQDVKQRQATNIAELAANVLLPTSITSDSSRKIS